MRSVIPRKILEFAAGHLQLSERCRLAIDDEATIGRLLRLHEAHKFDDNPAVDRELTLVFRQLKNCYAGKQAWDEFRVARAPLLGSTCVYFASDSFERLKLSVLSLPVGTLHPTARAATTFKRANIANLGQLLESAKQGLVNPRPAGAGTCRQITQMLEAFSISTTSEGGCDWAKYAFLRHIAIVPEKQGLNFTLANVIQRACELQLGELGLLIATRQIFAKRQDRLTLAEIGSLVGMVRQEVERMKGAILRMIRRALLHRDYTSCRFRFREEFSEPIRAVAAGLARRTGNRIIPYAKWEKLITNLGLSMDGESGQGLLQILGFDVLTECECPLKPIIIPKGRDHGCLRKAIRKMRLLLGQRPGGITQAALLQELKQYSKNAGLLSDDVSAIVMSLPGVERVAKGTKFRCAVRDLSSVNDRLERVLREKGKPMHFRELTMTLKQAQLGIKRGPSERSVATALSCDDRFAPIARTGLWILSEWKQFENCTIPDLAASLLAAHRGAMTETELFKSMRRVRDLSQESIRSRLATDSRFVRVAPYTWALA